jgi:hypothetical protein
MSRRTGDWLLADSFLSQEIASRMAPAGHLGIQKKAGTDRSV